jgi:hypothetical protein
MRRWQQPISRQPRRTILRRYSWDTAPARQPDDAAPVGSNCGPKILHDQDHGRNPGDGSGEDVGTSGNGISRFDLYIFSTLGEVINVHFRIPYNQRQCTQEARQPGREVQCALQKGREPKLLAHASVSHCTCPKPTPKSAVNFRRGFGRCRRPFVE